MINCCPELPHQTPTQVRVVFVPCFVDHVEVPRY
jgi:hypothetical protein